MALFFSSCFEQTDCLINNTNILKIGLKGRTLGKDTTVTFLSIRTLEDETILYENKNLSKVEVPLQISDTVTTVIFDYNESIVVSDTVQSIFVSDTLTLAYKNQTRVISRDCGAYLYQLDAYIPESTFEKVRVTSSILLTTVTINLEIFL